MKESIIFRTIYALLEALIKDDKQKARKWLEELARLIDGEAYEDYEVVSNEDGRVK